MARKFTKEGYSLSREAVAAPEPAEMPVYDPEALAVQTYSDGGAGLIQGKNLFTSHGTFVKVLSEAQWYLTTPEQEANNRKARAKQRAMFAGRGTARKGPQLPDKLLDISRENSRVLAAESLAE
jgi:hypothetical protein